MKSPDLSLRGPKGTVASSQRPAGSQAAHSEFEIPSHIVPAASPPGLFPFTVLHIIENYGIFSVKILTKKLRGDMLDLSEGNHCPNIRSIGTEGENAHEKPEINWKLLAIHDRSHRHFLALIRLHKAEIGAYDKYLGIALLHSRLAIQ
ncbi:MAG: hypothetical protein V8T47_10210 [Oscillospiraceae bacterium]